MQRNKLSLNIAITLAAFATTLWGCSSERQVVFVDAEKLSQQVLGTNQPGLILSSPAEQASTFNSDPVEFGLDSRKPQARVLTSDSLDRSSARRIETIEKLRKSRFDQLEKSLNQRKESATNRFDLQREILIRDAIDRTRVPFDKYSDEIGKRALEKANISASLPTLGDIEPEHILKQAQTARIKELDAEMLEINTRYLKERDTIFEQTAVLIAGRERGIEVEIAGERDRQTRNILQDIQELSRSSSPLERSFAQKAEPFRLEDFSWAQKPINLNTKKLDLKFSTESSPPKNAKLLQSDIERWAGLMGYDLAKNAGQGRDATNEFVTWRKSHRLGP